MEEKIPIHTKSSLTLDFDNLPLEGFDTGRKSVQKCFNKDFAKLTANEQHYVTKLLGQKNFSKEDTVIIRNMFQKYESYQGGEEDENPMDNEPVDYANLDQLTKQRILSD